MAAQPHATVLHNNRTLYVGFQELDRYKRRGFPWTEFEIVEASHSRVFFMIKRVGDRLTPSVARPPLPWKELTTLCDLNKPYQFVDVDFASLKEECPQVAAERSGT